MARLNGFYTVTGNGYPKLIKQIIAMAAITLGLLFFYQSIILVVTEMNISTAVDEQKKKKKTTKDSGFFLEFCKDI